MTDNVELVVKIASGGTGQPIKDVVDLQQSIKTLGKDARDTQKLAQSLGKAFNLPDDQVRDLAEALAEAKQETSKLKKEANGLGKIFEGIAQGVGQSLANQGIEALRGSLSAVIGVATAALGEFQGFEKALVEFDAMSDATAEQSARIGEQAKELAAVTSQMAERQPALPQRASKRRYWHCRLRPVRRMPSWKKSDCQRLMPMANSEAWRRCCWRPRKLSRRPQNRSK